MTRGRGGAERRQGRLRHTKQVNEYAESLAAHRAALDGMNGSDEDFDARLLAAEQVATDLAATATRMDRGSQSRRAACENIIARAIAPAIMERPIKGTYMSEFTIQITDTAAVQEHARILAALEMVPEAWRQAYIETLGPELADAAVAGTVLVEA